MPGVIDRSFIVSGVMLALVSLSLEGCKAHSDRSSESSVKTSDVVLNGEAISLDNYVATAADFAEMHFEIQEMLRFDPGQDNYDYLLRRLTQTSPKVRVKPGSRLETDEKLALILWTIEFVPNALEPSPYTAINRALRNASATGDEAIDGTARVLASALNKIQGQVCGATRGVASLPASYLQLAKGEIFKDSGFVAFGMGGAPPAPYDELPIYITVHSAECKNIAGFSKFNEEEVLFPPGTDFLVESNSIDSRGRRTIVIFPRAENQLPDIQNSAFAGANNGGAIHSYKDFINKIYVNDIKNKIAFSPEYKCTFTYKLTDGTPDDERWCTWIYDDKETKQIIVLVEAVPDNRTWYFKVESSNSICFSGDAKPTNQCVSRYKVKTP
ncbi:hypothetical protein E3A20_02480 [Planctomyces bekefii]|uniref:NAD(+)--protein-arginine ADP-ribosyltransferase n=1 Tax=Planctomyces bekefii TaxID=1653850 RepID=A0A5C6MBL7_9PLAN|nr:hypothetical protein E3A20_02480 [Planctomyces bekefii]